MESKLPRRAGAEAIHCLLYTSLVTGTPGAGVINFTSLRPNFSTLSYSYDVADNPVIYPVEAAWTGCYFEEMPELPPAQESSFGHFRKSIPMRFLSNGDRYPTP